MGTIVYIDGFNFYYGAIKGTPYKWLDLPTFCDRLLPNDNVTMVRYFTARMSGGSANRQDVYWRALSTTGRTTVHLGNFKPRVKRGTIVDPPHLAGTRGAVEAPEEKGSDVNLASHVLHDGFNGDYQTAVVISNDSDLCEPVRLVRESLKLRVGIVNPKHGRAPYQLSGDFVARINIKDLANSQLPQTVTMRDGKTLTKPASW